MTPFANARSMRDHTWMIATNEIFSLRNGFEMRRIHTFAVAANMVDLQSFRNMSVDQFVRNPMGPDTLSAFPRNSPVAIGRNIAVPIPTSRAVFLMRRQNFSTLISLVNGRLPVSLMS
jgi:hypothetical protein